MFSFAVAGLQIIYAKLNISTEEHKKTMDYVRTLNEKKEVNLYVGFYMNIANSNGKDDKQKVVP